MARTEYRLAAGIISAVTLNASAAYLIENFTKQADMISGLVWTPPSGLDSTFPELVRTETLDQAVGRHGFYAWEWIFPAWTTDQMGLFETTYWGTSNESGIVTAKTRLKNGSYEEFTATMIKPGNDDFARGYGSTDGTFRNVRIRFVGGEVI